MTYRGHKGKGAATPEAGAAARKLEPNRPALPDWSGLPSGPGVSPEQLAMKTLAEGSLPKGDALRDTPEDLAVLEIAGRTFATLLDSAVEVRRGLLVLMSELTDSEHSFIRPLTEERTTGKGAP